jgi:hypothetical protein
MEKEETSGLAPNSGSNYVEVLGMFYTFEAGLIATA